MVKGEGFDPDEVPTQPNAAADPTLTTLIQVHSDACPIDRRKLARLVNAWWTMPNEARILLEMLADYLDKSTRGA